MAYFRGNDDALPAAIQRHVALDLRGKRVVPLVNLRGLGVNEELLAVNGLHWVEFTHLAVTPGTTVMCDSNVT